MALSRLPLPSFPSLFLAGLLVCLVFLHLFVFLCLDREDVREKRREEKRGRGRKRSGGGCYDRRGEAGWRSFGITSIAEPQKVCVAEREEAAATAQAHLDGRRANAMLVRR